MCKNRNGWQEDVQCLSASVNNGCKVFTFRPRMVGDEAEKWNFYGHLPKKMTICIGFLFRSCYLFYSKEEHWYFIIAAVVSTARLYPLTSLKNSSRLWAYLELGRHVLLSLRAPKAFPKSLFVQDSISIKLNVKYYIVLKLKTWIWFELGPFSNFFNH